MCYRLSRTDGWAIDVLSLAGTVVRLVRLMTGKEVQQALRGVIAETHFEDPVCFRGFGSAAGKESCFVCAERGFNVPRVGGNNHAEFSAIEHCEVGSFARRRHQVRRIAK